MASKELPGLVDGDRPTGGSLRRMLKETPAGKAAAAV
jgi:hypothetical protein